MAMAQSPLPSTSSSLSSYSVIRTRFAKCSGSMQTKRLRPWQRKTQLHLWESCAWAPKQVVASRIRPKSTPALLRPQMKTSWTQTRPSLSSYSRVIRQPWPSWKLSNFNTSSVKISGITSSTAYSQMKMVESQLICSSARNCQTWPEQTLRSTECKSRRSKLHWERKTPVSQSKSSLYSRSFSVKLIWLRIRWTEWASSNMTSSRISSMRLSYVRITWRRTMSRCLSTSAQACSISLTQMSQESSSPTKSRISIPTWWVSLKNKKQRMSSPRRCLLSRLRYKSRSHSSLGTHSDYKKQAINI